MSRRSYDSFSPIAKNGDVGHDENENNDGDETESEEELSSPPRDSICKKLQLFLNAQFFLVAVVMAIGLALAAPSVGKSGGMIYSQYTISYGATVCIFLITGLSLKTSQFANAFMSIGFNCYTQFFIFLAIPGMTFAVVKLLQSSFISPALLDGLLITVWGLP